jgi:hypothetical protein
MPLAIRAMPLATYRTPPRDRHPDLGDDHGVTGRAFGESWRHVAHPEALALTLAGHLGRMRERTVVLRERSPLHIARSFAVHCTV